MDRRIWTATALITIALGFSGCKQGPVTAEVHGQVTLDGQPLTEASVSFIPANGRPSEAYTDQEGKFVLRHTRSQSGCLLGPHKVLISTFEMYRRPELVPAEYNERTTLTFDVQPGGNEANFNLTGKIKKPARPE
ncbi:hypothetical protein [Planctomicrobium sp. SH664]|uniref:hypothetical protein n=1 Tax=Planctomicrobium sp. SH664 TaxID=3448125 RepID=UPI003F5BE070